MDRRAISWGVLAVIGLGTIACLCAPSSLFNTLTPDAISGIWREEGQVRCDDGSVTSPGKPIGELVFRGGEFSVTWQPFETYKDYWGTYQYDPETGALSLSADASSFNYLPADLDGEGRAEIDAQGRLVLSEMWLGTPGHIDGVAQPVGTFCGQIFFAP